MLDETDFGASGQWPVIELRVGEGKQWYCVRLRKGRDNEDTGLGSHTLV